jgi:hypothetical protein
MNTNKKQKIKPNKLKKTFKKIFKNTIQNQFKENLKKTKIQEGGRFLSKGGFGCVIKPAILCNLRLI